jgi:hypothetical protein
MKAFIATVDLVIRAESWAQACDALHNLLTVNGIHAECEPALVDWAYVPRQRPGDGEWPKQVVLRQEWLAMPEGERDASFALPERQHIEPMLVIGLAHLPRRPNRVHTVGTSEVIRYPFGWIVNVDANIDGLVAIQEYARDLGCFWIKFDRDGPVLDHLPTFNH